MRFRFSPFALAVVVWLGIGFVGLYLATGQPSALSLCVGIPGGYALVTALLWAAYGRK